MVIDSSKKVFLLLNQFYSEYREEFWALALRKNKTLIEKKCLFRGTVDACSFHPRDFFRFACITNSSELIIAHNHPSGDPLPSHQDIQVTQNLLKASQVLQIPILDHVIFTKTSYFSMADHNLFSFQE